MKNITEIVKERFLLQEEFLGENKEINNITPLVSVTVITYHHALYIKQCLDGILMQKVDFPYEIIIGEDGSTDGTKEICIEYAKKYPDKIRLFNRDRSLSQFKTDDGKVVRFNGLWNIMSCRGKYVAYCEGDDYWIDSYKLQKQVDILEQNPNIGLCYTKIRKYIQERKKFGSIWGGGNINFDELLMLNTIPTLSCLLRRELIKRYYNEIKPENKSWKMGDYPMWLWISNNSSIFFLPDITGVYRVLKNSASHSSNLINRIGFVISTFDIRLFYASKYNSNKYDIIEQEYIWWHLILSILEKENDKILLYKKKLIGKKTDFKKRIIIYLSDKYPRISHTLVKKYIELFIG